MVACSEVYGFIGLGQMGHGMAKNIRLKIAASSTLIIYDINQDAMHQFVKDLGKHGNIIEAASPKEVAEKADIIMTSVPQSSHVKKVFLDPGNGLLAAETVPGKQRVFLELSTIDTGVSAEIAQQVLSKGHGLFVDAPCSGGAMGAESGTLSFMVGCPTELFPVVFAICKLMGKEEGIFHCGELGSGLKTKLLNNYLSSLTALATAETINIGIHTGLDARKLNDVLNASSGMNFNSKINNPVPGLTPNSPASKGYVGGFSLELCLGVLELGLKAAHDSGAKTVLGDPMLAAFRDAAQVSEYHGKDSKIIYKWLGGQDPILAHPGN